MKRNRRQSTLLTQRVNGDGNCVIYKGSYHKRPTNTVVKMVSGSSLPTVGGERVRDSEETRLQEEPGSTLKRYDSDKGGIEGVDITRPRIMRTTTIRF